jgi:hypothetical protein
MVGSRCEPFGGVEERSGVAGGHAHRRRDLLVRAAGCGARAFVGALARAARTWHGHGVPTSPSLCSGSSHASSRHRAGRQARPAPATPDPHLPPALAHARASSPCSNLHCCHFPPSGATPDGLGSPGGGRCRPARSAQTHSPASGKRGCSCHSLPWRIWKRPAQRGASRYASWFEELALAATRGGGLSFAGLQPRLSATSSSSTRTKRAHMRIEPTEARVAFARKPQLGGYPTGSYPDAKAS